MNPATQSGTAHCDTVSQVDFHGTQLGFDIARLNFNGGGDFFLGLTAGHTWVKSKDKTQGEGTFSSEFEVPFAGIYAGFASGPISLDAQVRWDAYRGTLTDNIPVTYPGNFVHDSKNQALYGQLLNANSLTFLWNAAYRHNIQGTNWFVEPSVGGIWSRTRIDNLDVNGNYLTNSDGLSPPATIAFDDVQTLLGRASLRVGTTIVSSGIALQPFLTGSIFHEFAGDAKASGSGSLTADNFPNAATAFDSSTSRVGTYGHVGVGLAGVVLDSGWLGYARLDYRKGDNIEGLSANAGLRYQFSPTNPDGLKDGQDVYISPVNWAGAYVGLMGGALFSQSRLTGDGEEIGPRASGGLIGGQIGYNFQSGHIVFGPEAEWSASNAEGSNGCPGEARRVTANPVNGVVDGPLVPRKNFWDCRASLNQLGIIAGRFGVTWERALLYVKGGLAIGEIDVRSQFNDESLRTAGAGENAWSFGWALGGGIEFALNTAWSIRVNTCTSTLDRKPIRSLARKYTYARSWFGK
ncbi:MAG: autotransporter domain-containing protein [Hyphomicrobiaceae bacterium]